MFSSIRKKMGALALSLSMVLAIMPNTVFAAESTVVTEATETEVTNQPAISITKVSNDVNVAAGTKSTDSKDYVHRAGMLNPGSSISGSFELTGWFGNNFNIIGCAGNSGVGALSLSFLAARYDLPCDGVARVLCRETGWSAGTYSYYLSNPTSQAVSYVLHIYEP